MPGVISRDGVGYVTGMWDRGRGWARARSRSASGRRDPGGATARAISGHHCACEYRSVAEGGRRRTRMGRCVGKTGEGRGYVPDPGRASGSGTAVLVQ